MRSTRSRSRGGSLGRSGTGTPFRTSWSFSIANHGLPQSGDNDAVKKDVTSSPRLQILKSLREEDGEAGPGRRAIVALLGSEFEG